MKPWLTPLGIVALWSAVWAAGSSPDRADVPKRAADAWARLQAAGEPRALPIARLENRKNGYAVSMAGVRAALEKACLNQAVRVELLAPGGEVVPLGSYSPQPAQPNALGPQPEPPDQPAAGEKPKDPAVEIGLNPQPEPPARFAVPDRMVVVTRSPLAPGRAKLRFRESRGKLRASLPLDLVPARR